MRRLLLLLAAALPLVFSLSAATAASAERAWTITDLGIEDGAAHDINNHGT